LAFSNQSLSRCPLTGIIPTEADVIKQGAFHAEIEADKTDAAFLESKRGAVLILLHQTGLAEEETNAS
jgi:hypothetical protein